MTVVKARAEARERARRERRQSPCPTCGASAGERCKGPSGYRKSVHRDRGRAAEPSHELVAASQPSPIIPMSVGKTRVGRLNEIILEAMDEIEELHRAQITHFSSRCESPIEELFAAVTILHREGARHLGVEMYHFGSEFTQERRACDWDSTDVYTQAQIGAYRVDFLFDDLANGKRRFFVVELDGHDWHERTKEQAARDKKRDRALVAAGFSIMRFTGSEVYRNPAECLQEVVEAILRARQ